MTPEERKHRERVFEAMDKNPKILKLEKEFDEFCEKYTEKYGNEYPIGVLIYKTLKDELDTNLSKEERVREYKRMISGLTKQVLTEDEVLDDKELNRVIELLKSDLALMELDESKSNSKEKYSHIFCNNGFEFFEYLVPNDTDRNKSGHQRDVIYFYHRMKEDKYISIMITPFLEWYNDEYGTAITQSVTIEQAEDSKGNRDRYYSSLLSQFKQQK